MNEAGIINAQATLKTAACESETFNESRMESMNILSMTKDFDTAK